MTTNRFPTRILSLPMCLLALLTVGCGPAPNAKVTTAQAKTEHSHPNEGPHQGQLIELGNEEYHLELSDDDTTHKVSIYVLDSTAKKSVPIEAKELTINLVVDSKPIQFKLAAVSQSDDPEGKASCFQLVDEKLCVALDAKGTKGRVNVTIENKPYTGSIDHHDHGSHKH